MKSFVTALGLALALLATPFSALADGGTQADIVGVQSTLDSSATAGPFVSLGTRLIKETEHVLKVQFDFAKLGGASGAVLSLRGEDNKAAKLPKNAIVRDCLIDVITTPTGASGSPTIALGTGQTATDLKTATAVASY